MRRPRQRWTGPFDTIVIASLNNRIRRSLNARTAWHASTIIISITKRTIKDIHIPATDEEKSNNPQVPSSTHLHQKNPQEQQININAWKNFTEKHKYFKHNKSSLQNDNI